MNLHNVFLEVEAIAFSSDATDHVASNQIRMKQGGNYTTVDPKQWVGSRRAEEQGQTHDMRKN